MLAFQIKDLLHLLRSGKLDVASVAPLEQLVASGLIADLRSLYPVMFQERVIGRKHEVGMARSLQFEFAIRKQPDSHFPQVLLLPVLRKCLFVSSYDDAISEVTTTASILVGQKIGATKEVVLKMERGYKLDRTPDGWALKPLRKRAVTLSETFLIQRGWRFESLVPFRTP
jgi:hypothetical protein